MEQKFDYDFFVIGGGSGGMAAVKAAQKKDKKLRCAVADYVRPTPLGLKWGIGGTCVNVGCIPKKMMHWAAVCGELIHDAKDCGWEVNTDAKHNWQKMQKAVAAHIRNLNKGYEDELKGLGITWYNRCASLADAHTVVLTNDKGEVEKVTADKILIAAGGRPRYPGTENDRECCITSDDVFWLEKSPGKTLIIGAGYIALECGGFLNGIGLDVTIAVRSVLLRGFDREMVESIGRDMESKGTNFMYDTVVTAMEKGEDGRVTVTFASKKTGEEKGKETYDTVMAAIGRVPETKALNLESAGVKTNKWGFIETDENEKTSADNIFAIGDNAVAGQELTPVAIQAGRLLAKRLFENPFGAIMDHTNVCTCVFTPLEYGSVGLTEEKAREQWKDELDVVKTQVMPLEWQYTNTHQNTESKLKILIDPMNQILGIHILAPNAGEIIMGFAVAMKCGLGKSQLFDTVGLHPTIAEDIVNAEEPGC